MRTLDDLKPGLRHSATIRVTDELAVPASGHLLGASVEMPPVFATAQMIAFVEWTCVAALAPYLAPQQRTVGTHVEMTHSAATPIGMRVTAEVELIGRRLRFKVRCHDGSEPIGEGFHERMTSTASWPGWRAKLDACADVAIISHMQSGNGIAAAAGLAEVGAAETDRAVEAEGRIAPPSYNNPISRRLVCRPRPMMT
jgi:fluoroacetyl-CoA thioesterase